MSWATWREDFFGNNTKEVIDNLIPETEIRHKKENGYIGYWEFYKWVEDFRRLSKQAFDDAENLIKRAETNLELEKRAYETLYLKNKELEYELYMIKRESELSKLNTQKLEKA